MPPKRRRVVRHASNDVQGEGSWVIVASLTVRESREEVERSKEEGYDVIEASVNIVKTHTYEWNWVDDDGEPLPQPQEDPSIIGELSTDEFTFLSECISGSEAEAKN